jgi:hypothetical protein
MVPITSVEMLQDLLKFGKDLLPLLSEKKLDTAIAGLAEARAVVDKFKAIQTDIVAAEEKLSKAVAMEAENAARTLELEKAIGGLNGAITAVAKREADASAAEKANKDEAAKLAKAIASNEKKDAKLTEALAKAEADLKEIEEAKAAITAKLAKLAEVA